MRMPSSLYMTRTSERPKQPVCTRLGALLQGQAFQIFVVGAAAHWVLCLLFWPFGVFHGAARLAKLRVSDDFLKIFFLQTTCRRCERRDSRIISLQIGKKRCNRHSKKAGKTVEILRGGLVFAGLPS